MKAKLNILGYIKHYVNSDIVFFTIYLQHHLKGFTILQITTNNGYDRELFSIAYNSIQKRIWLGIFFRRFWKNVL